MKKLLRNSFVVLFVFLIFNGLTIYVHADMIVESTISHVETWRGKGAYISCKIILRNVDKSIYNPISEAIRRFDPIRTYYIYPSGPLSGYHRLRLYGLGGEEEKRPVMWFHANITRAVNTDVDVKVRKIKENGQFFLADGQRDFYLDIYMGIAEIVSVHVDGVSKTENVDYEVDYSTGRITFLTTPPNGSEIEVIFKAWDWESIGGFPVFFNMTLNDAERSMIIYVEIPDSELGFPRITPEKFASTPFLNLTEYPNGTDVYTLDRQLFDSSLPFIKDAILDIFRSMTELEWTPSLDFWTPSVAFLRNGTVIQNVWAIEMDHMTAYTVERRVVYPLSTTWEELLPLASRQFIEMNSQNATIYTYSNRSSAITLENGTRILVPYGEVYPNRTDISYIFYNKTDGSYAFYNKDDIPYVDFDNKAALPPDISFVGDGIIGANWTRAILHIDEFMDHDIKSLRFMVDDGTLWTPLRYYLIWKNETEFLSSLENAIDKMGYVFNFEWLKTPLEEWKQSYWNETILLGNGTTVDEETFTQVYNKTDGSHVFFKNYTVDSFTIYMQKDKWVTVIKNDGTTLNFNNQTQVKMATLETQRHFIIDNRSFMEIKTHRSLYLHSTVPWPYGDPEAFLAIPDEATDVSVKGDILTFKTQRYIPSTPFWSEPLFWVMISVPVIAIATVATIVFLKKRQKK